MKSQFLKIAGVKTEAAFYKKYKTEKEFFSAHPEAKKMIKKAQMGAVMPMMNSYLQGMNNVPNIGNTIQGQMSSPGVNAGMFSGPQVDNNVSTINASQLTDDKSGYAFSGGPNTNVEKMNNIGNIVSKGADVISGFSDIYSGLRAERKAKKNAQMWAKVTDVQARAAESEDIDDFRQYTENMNKKRRAFMPVNTGEEFFPIYGVGTNVLAKNGIKLESGSTIGGNPTEIQNTYSPEYDMYSDLEYEPLNDFNEVKQYYVGGKIKKAQTGLELGLASSALNLLGGGMSSGQNSNNMSTNNAQLGQFASGIASNLGGNNATSGIGNVLTSPLKGIPVVSEFSGLIAAPLNLAGGLLNTNNRDRKKAEAKIKNNQNRMLTSQMREANKQMFGSYMEDGGYVSNNWNPQVIAKFGDLDEQDYARFAHKDEFRAGGHLKSYTPPSERAMETFDMGGELQTHWGGYAEPMSYNPYLPDGGETVMFRGKSHEEYSPNGETGIGITYGDNPVEVERGEPAVKLKDGYSGEDNLTVYGNLMIPEYGVDILGDKKAKGKKFKNYIADISKTEAKQNKLVEKSTNDLDELDLKTPFDKLKLSSLQANILGGNMKLKDVADKKIKAADLQNAINDTAEEYGLVADDLARGKVKIDKEAMKAQAKYGTTIDKFQGGGYKTKGRGDKWSFTQAGETGNPLFDDMQRYDNEWVPSVNAALSDKDRSKKMLKYIESYSGEGSDNIKKALNKIPTEEGKIIFLQQQGTNKEVGPIHHVVDAAIKFTEPSMTTALKDDKKTTPADKSSFETVPYKRSALIDAFGQLLPYIRPTDQEELDPTQLAGEMFALSTNKLEPVQAQPYNPELRVPYDISRQAAKNDLIAQTRAAQRMAQGNPAAQAMIAAQAYSPMQQLNEQDFIDNQRMKDAVYSGNIAALNDAELKNLAIYDQQYTRQEQAKSNTKATAQAALNSISDKYAKNRLENRTLGVYENLYNYRFDNAGRAINMNAPFQANIPYIYGADGKITHKIIKDANNKIIGYQPVTEEEFTTEQISPIPSLSTGPIVQQNSVDYIDYIPIDEKEYTNQEYMDQVAPKKLGGKVKKKYSQSSIVRAFK